MQEVTPQAQRAAAEPAQWLESARQRETVWGLLPERQAGQVREPKPTREPDRAGQEEAARRVRAARRAPRAAPAWEE